MSQLKIELDLLTPDDRRKIMEAFNEEQSCFVKASSGKIIAVYMPAVPEATLVEDYGIWSIHEQVK